MIHLLIWLLVLILIFGLIWYAISLLPLPAPFGQIAQIVLVIILVLVLVNLLLNYGPPLWNAPIR